MRWRPRSRVSIRALVLILIGAGVCGAALSLPAARQAAPRPFPSSAWAAIAHGKAAEAESLARARPAGDPDAAGILGYLAARRGRQDEALATLEPAAQRAPLSEAALQLGLLQQRLGRRDDARRILTALFRGASGTEDAATLARAARAAQALGEDGTSQVRQIIQDANALYRTASRLSDDPAIQTAWGFLFLWAHDDAEASKSFQQVLKADPDWAPAHLGMARVLSDEDPGAAAAGAKRALEIDPQLAEARLLLARFDVDNARFDAARGEIDKVLADDPTDVDAHALLGAIAYVRDDRAVFDAQVRKVLAINPAFSDVYRVAAEVSARNYRFDDAVALSTQAITMDPGNFRAQAELGMNLMRTGQEAEARRALERSFNAHPFEKVTWNLLLLLDTLDKFVVEKSGDLVFKFHPDEAAIMREYAVPLAHEALKTLSARYQFTPRGPILIEMFPDHDDFAVRTLGLPGMLGALGACFGRVVTLDSPKAREPGTFSWQATLWHELAHVVTLQMSNQRVPRWLTEGISVYEEARARPEWGREMEVRFAGALERGETLKLKDLNAGFTRPETIALAYYQASLLVEHIVATHGEAALRALVRGYGEGAEGDAAIAKALNVPLDTLQETFDRAVQAKFGPLMTALKGSAADGARGARGGGPDSIDALKAAAAAQPGSYAAQLALGRALAGAKDRAAFGPLEKAAALVPVATGDNSPHALMARLAEELEDVPRAIREYRALLAHDHANVDAARRLALLAAKAKDDAALALGHERVVALDPFDSAAHTGTGRLALARGDAVIASREFRAALLTGASDRASAHCDLGESYLLAGRPADAKREALAALEIAPTFERAQDLLLKIVEKGAGAK